MSGCTKWGEDGTTHVEKAGENLYNDFISQLSFAGLERQGSSGTGSSKVRERTGCHSPRHEAASEVGYLSLSEDCNYKIAK